MKDIICDCGHALKDHIMDHKFINNENYCKKCGELIKFSSFHPFKPNNLKTLEKLYESNM